MLRTLLHVCHFWGWVCDLPPPVHVRSSAWLDAFAAGLFATAARLDLLRDHHSACATSGVLASRAFPLEHTVARRSRARLRSAARRKRHQTFRSRPAMPPRLVGIEVGGR